MLLELLVEDHTGDIFVNCSLPYLLVLGDAKSSAKQGYIINLAVHRGCKSSYKGRKQTPFRSEAQDIPFLRAGALTMAFSIDRITGKLS